MKEYRIQNIECRIGNLSSFAGRQPGNFSHLPYVSHLLYSVSCILCPVFCLLFLSGCQKPLEGPSPADQIKQLTRENAKLQQQLEQTNTQNNELKSIIDVLSSLGKEGRLESLSPLKSIHIGRYTNFYDKDKDGKKEQLIVYVQPVDNNGDKVKAPGEIEVQLWNLNNSADEALLGSWKIGPEELKKMWFATVVTINYRLIFDIPEAVRSFHEPLTVKVTFKDHLTGHTFEDQKVIEPPQTAKNAESNS